MNSPFPRSKSQIKRVIETLFTSTHRSYPATKATNHHALPEANGHTATSSPRKSYSTSRRRKRSALKESRATPSTSAIRMNQMKTRKIMDRIRAMISSQDLTTPRKSSKTTSCNLTSTILMRCTMPAARARCQWLRVEPRPTDNRARLWRARQPEVT